MLSDIALKSVAEDLEWLAQEWARSPERLSDADIRRGVATLRRLLIDGQGAIRATWRMLGLTDQPRITSPDLAGYMARNGHTLPNVIMAIAGGAPIEEVQVLLISFAQASGKADMKYTIRHLAPEIEPWEGSHDIREWSLSQFVEGLGAVRMGQPISRRELIQIFAKDFGGVHADPLHGSPKKRSLVETVGASLHGKLDFGWREGMHYAVLSIGFALGHSSDLEKLATAIRQRVGAG